MIPKKGNGSFSQLRNCFSQCRQKTALIIESFVCDKASALSAENRFLTLGVIELQSYLNCFCILAGYLLVTVLEDGRGRILIQCGIVDDFFV